MQDEKTFRPVVSLWLSGSKSGRPFFGAGCASLLRGIQAHGNVLAACAQMGLSYSKGRHMLKLMEKEAGRPVALCVKGGPEGGAATVTPEGERLLEIYERYKDEISRFAEGRYQEKLDAERKKPV
jgi:molybdate transport system regulatory protein